MKIPDLWYFLLPMKKKEKLILMNKDDEVLSFLVDYKKSSVHILEKLECFDKAPYRVFHQKDELDIALLHFFRGRTINENRSDFDNILNATGCSSALELAFKVHALSLSDHYWIKRVGENLKYEDISFFKNKWDDSFAKAVLNGDYEALKHCDLNVPDVVTSGWGVKGWINEDTPKLFKLGIDKETSDECIAEVLASKLAQKILKEDEVTKYELRKVGEKYASVSSVMINYDEELVPLSTVLPRELYFLYLAKSKDKELDKKFFEKIKASEIPDLYEFFIRLSVLRTLCFVSDIHFDNISLIKNTKTNEYRVAPIYDLGGAFGSSRTGREMLSKPTKGLYLLVYFMFNNLDPSWDYSWYEPAKLDGFEDEIREMLSKSKSYDDELIERIVAVYQMQKEMLDKTAKH